MAVGFRVVADCDLVRCEIWSGVSYEVSRCEVDAGRPGIGLEVGLWGLGWLYLTLR